MAKLSFKDKIDGNELDLSLNELTEVPVKELASAPRATHVDLSCNKIQELPTTFASLTHLVKVDLSKNLLTALPYNFGNLTNLQYLDLYGNELVMLPVSFCRLKNLRWLDLKNNPLDPKLKAVAGDCLDEKQCQICAKKVVSFMQTIDSNLEREKQKKLKEEREKEAARKAEEERELERMRQQKKAERERRKAELKAQKEQLARQKQEDQTTAKDGIGKNGTVKASEVRTKRSGSFWKSLVLIFICLLMTCGAGTVVGFLVFSGLSFSEIQLKLEESLLVTKENILLWWNAFAVPYLLSVQHNLLQWLNSTSLYNITTVI